MNLESLPLDDQKDCEAMSQSDHILQILADQKKEIEELEASNKDLRQKNHELSILLNRHRLMMYPRTQYEDAIRGTSLDGTSGGDYIDNCSRVDIDLLQMIEDDPSLEKISQFVKQHLYYTSRGSELIDKNKSKQTIKIKNLKDAELGKQKVTKTRSEPKTPTAKKKLNELDKALKGIYSTFGKMMGEEAFISFVRKTPAYAEITEDAIRESIEKFK